MFDDIGGKIKTVAKVVCWVGIIMSVITGIVLISTANTVGILTIIVGSLGSWIGSFTLYGFGELIEKTTEIAENTRPVNTNMGSTKINVESSEASDGSVQENNEESTNQVASIYARCPSMFKYQELNFVEDAGSGRCQLCFKQDNLARYKIRNSIGVRIIPICQTCVSHMTKDNNK